MKIEKVKQADGMQFTITAPLWWWRELYRLTPSMDAIESVKFSSFSKDNFEFPKECANLELFGGGEGNDIGWLYNDIMTYCQECYVKALETNDNRYFLALLSILPESYLNTQTITLNSVLMHSICRAKILDERFEWVAFCYVL